MFQRYGEDYDEIVGQMPRSEKMRLKQEVGSMEAKDPDELLTQQQPDSTQVSNAAASVSTHSFIKVVEKDEDLLKSPPFCPENSIFMPPTAVAPQQGSIEPSLTESVAAKTQAPKSNPEVRPPKPKLKAPVAPAPVKVAMKTLRNILILKYIQHFSFYVLSDEDPRTIPDSRQVFQSRDVSHTDLLTCLATFGRTI